MLASLLGKMCALESNIHVGCDRLETVWQESKYSGQILERECKEKQSIYYQLSSRVFTFKVEQSG